MYCKSLAKSRFERVSAFEKATDYFSVQPFEISIKMSRIEFYLSSSLFKYSLVKKRVAQRSFTKAVVLKKSLAISISLFWLQVSTSCWIFESSFLQFTGFSKRLYSWQTIYLSSSLFHLKNLILRIWQSISKFLGKYAALHWKYCCNWNHCNKNWDASKWKRS